MKEFSTIGRSRDEFLASPWIPITGSVAGMSVLVVLVVESLLGRLTPASLQFSVKLGTYVGTVVSVMVGTFGLVLFGLVSE